MQPTATGSSCSHGSDDERARARRECQALLLSLGRLLDVPVAATPAELAATANTASTQPADATRAAVAAQTVVVDDVLRLCEHGVDHRRIVAGITARCEAAPSEAVAAKSTSTKRSAAAHS